MFKKKKIIASLALIIMLVGCNSGSETSEDGIIVSSKVIVVETKPSNWYIRLVVEDPARAMKTAASQLGELEVSDAVEKHTLKALTPFVSSYLDIVFRDPAGVEAGDYTVNFHDYDGEAEDRWNFTVRTDDTTADILLTWRGIYVLTTYVDDQNRQRYKEYQSLSNPLVKNMKLVDSSNGKEIAAVVDGKIQSYSFNMEGQTERTFEWVVQVDEVMIPEQTSKLSTLQAKAIQKDASINKVKILSKKAETFDLNNPPMIKEDNFGK